MTKPNWKEARQHIELIAGEADPVMTWQTFADKGDDEGLAAIYHGRLSDKKNLMVACDQEQARRWHLHHVGQDGQLGRRRDNMVEARVCSLDLDKSSLPENWELQPHLIEESSPGHFWAHWLIGYRRLQRMVILPSPLGDYGGDPTIHDPPRVARVPGFDHQKGDRFRSRIIESCGTERLPHGSIGRYTLQEVINAYRASSPRQHRAPKVGEAMNLKTVGMILKP